MRGPRAGRFAICLSLAGQAAWAAPTTSIREASSCTELSASSPNWNITKADSSDWPGGASGRVELFAVHIPTGTPLACDVEYQLNQTTGAIVGYDPALSHACVNFGAAPLNTTVTLDMATLRLDLASVWTCEGDDTTYAATGSVELQRDTSPGACLVEPTQVGEATTCPIANVLVEGKLAE
ncbi:hypothetical protein F5Y05DRAFT_157851 [Hypoxylon sp. FL0543]|nr:hypothetical protein F5Y05DRAFT_157851 [Hypoxylon sp. FL0543]